MNEEIIKQALGYIEQAGSIASSGAAYVWPLYIKNQIVAGFQSLIMGIVWFIVVGIMVRLWFQCASNGAATDTERGRPGSGDSNWWGGLLVCTVVIILVSFFGVMCISDAIWHLVNPEYAAIKDLLNQVVPKK